MPLVARGIAAVFAPRNLRTAAAHVESAVAVIEDFITLASGHFVALVSC